MTPKLSFIIPAHNADAFLAEAIQSCLDQSLKQVEVIVVNDGSSDSTQVLCDHFAKKDKRVKILRNLQPLGRGFARNQGCDHAQSDILAVLDADDISERNRAKETVKLLGSKDALVYGSAAIVNWASLQENGVRAAAFDLGVALETLYTNIVHSTCAYRRSLWEALRYDQGEYAKLGLDDWHFQMRAALLNYPILHTEAVLCAYRIHEGGISRNRDQKQVEQLKLSFLQEWLHVEKEEPQTAELEEVEVGA